MILEARELAIEGDRITAEGAVFGRQGERRMWASRADYDRTNDELDLFGDVLLLDPGYFILAPEAHVNTRTRLGSVESPRLQLLDSEAWLLADRLERYRSQRFRLEAACYTACTPPDSPPWSVRSSSVYVNQQSHFAHHWNSRFHLGPVPVFYTPYFGHYTDDDRHTGLLYPDIEFSGRRGTDITVPFYWNIAPQLDATLGVRNMTAKGAMGQLELRHLGPDIRSRFYGEFLANDDQTREDRHYIEAEQAGHLPLGLNYRLDARHVSDAEYISFFGNGVAEGSARHLTSGLSLSRAFGPYRWSTDFTYLQDLQDFNAPDTRQELPRMTLRGEQTLAGPLRLDWDSEYVYFYRREGERNHRLFADPTLSLGLQSSYGSLEPRAGVHWTGYRVVPQSGTAKRKSLTRTVPHASLRASSEVLRLFDFGDWALRHSVQPELFYLYVPHRDQSEVPVLDTSEPPLGFNDLFDMNRFSGIDRIGDANQLTTALTTRLDAKAGDRVWEAASLSVGQIRYFRDRRVSLSDQTDPDTRGYSNLFAEWALRPLPSAELTGSLEYDPDRPAFALNQMDAFQSQLAITPPGGHSLKASYLRRTGFSDGESVNQTEEVDTQARVRLTSDWEAFGGLRRSLKFGENLERRGGVDYHAGCWGIRLAWEDRLLRQASGASAPDRETRLFLTFRFRTLGDYEFATDP
ncbi:LPS-assembly protein LptD [Thiohalorhabdus sp.]|uniref:LPS-assembly protein LptD n=1 Tax=Thiohalorhabdus sp. TaxID=3094134 RepID=UPI002FC38DD4